MKKYFIQQLAILLPLLFVAGVAGAAYNFVGPTAGPTANNTDAPIDISGSTQTKSGGLSVNAFQSQNGSYFAQQVSLTGLVRGGTENDPDSTIQFGDSSHAVAVHEVGAAAITGSYQSNTLKTGGGLKPVCADQNGTIILCGSSGSTTNRQNSNDTLKLAYQTIAGQTYVNAVLSQAVNVQTTVTIDYTKLSGTPSSNAINYIENQFIAKADVDSNESQITTFDEGTGTEDGGDTDGTENTADQSGGSSSASASSAGTSTGAGTSGSGAGTVITQDTCKAGSTAQVLGTVTIPADTLASPVLELPSGCDLSNIMIYISAYQPHSQGNINIVSQ